MPEQHSRKPGGLALYLGIVQFFLLLTWTVYAIYLPELLASVGIDKGWTPWVLLADQVLFACFDVLAGFMADRAFRLYARIGYGVAAAAAVSCIAFAALPFVPGLGASPLIFLLLIAVWAVSSAALRSPLFALLARHAPQPEVPKLAGLALLGMGLAAAASPYLGALLKTLDPRLPFLLASLALLLTAGGLILAERGYGSPSAPKPQPAARAVPAPGWLPAVLLVALAVQIATFVNAAPRYLRDSDATWLPWLLPVFWVSFSFIVFAGPRLAKHWGPPRLFLTGCLVGAAGIGVTLLPGIEAAISGYGVAGIGWGLVLPSAFGMAAASGRGGRAGTYMGLLFAALAAAAFLRIGLNMTGWLETPALTQWVPLWPTLSWLAGGTLMLLVYGYLSRASKGSGGD
ncbi:MFS transporter [Thiorhodococcus minor]|uniref:MFS transporter n=1 Tax=Thiorhodococcus minor TaxID=57489 RepID=A0A6M0K3J8_9GAMM|nr:MFS transporter [Thiorhodococcus minor]NEV63854.1 MFS transporter [Thiorhodococcus minor]